MSPVIETAATAGLGVKAIGSTGLTLLGTAFLLANIGGDLAEHWATILAVMGMLLLALWGTLLWWIRGWMSGVDKFRKDSEDDRKLMGQRIVRLESEGGGLAQQMAGIREELHQAREDRLWQATALARIAGRFDIEVDPHPSRRALHAGDEAE